MVQTINRTHLNTKHVWFFEPPTVILNRIISGTGVATISLASSRPLTSVASAKPLMSVAPLKPLLSSPQRLSRGSSLQPVRVSQIFRHGEVAGSNHKSMAQTRLCKTYVWAGWLCGRAGASFTIPQSLWLWVQFLPAPIKSFQWNLDGSHHTEWCASESLAMAVAKILWLKIYKFSQ